MKARYHSTAAVRRVAEDWSVIPDPRKPAMM